MKSQAFRGYAGIGFVVFVGMYGCAIQPFFQPELDPPPNSGTSSGVGGTAGAGGNAGAGAGGMAGAAGMAGSGGVGGSGGACECTDDGNVCTDDLTGECPNGDANACHPAKLGMECPTGHCNKDGQCTDCLECAEAACMNRCDGQSCTEDAQCKNSHCMQKTCCDMQCDGPCKSCSRPDKEGDCTRMPEGLQVTGCDGLKLCDSQGTCIDKPAGKGWLGMLCANSTQCYSGICRREYCQSAVGEPCVEDLECTTSLCDPATKTCKSCVGPDAAKCPASSECMTQIGWCKVLPGQPVQASTECMAGTMAGFLCGLAQGEMCKEHAQCAHRNCVSGQCGPACDDAQNPCVGGVKCVNGSCQLPTGSYCITNEQCQSNTCAGFPRKCT